MALFSATAASARRPRALRGGVEESLGRLVRPGSPAGPARAAAASRLRSEGSPGGAGFSSVTAALPSPLCPLEPSAMKSPGGGCAARGDTATVRDSDSEGQRQRGTATVRDSERYRPAGPRDSPDGLGTALGRRTAAAFGRFMAPPSTGPGTDRATAGTDRQTAGATAGTERRPRAHGTGTAGAAPPGPARPAGQRRLAGGRGNCTAGSRHCCEVRNMETFP